MSSELSLRKVLDVVRAFAREQFPGEVPERVTIRFSSKRKVRLPLLGEPPATAPTPEQAFEPTEFQADLLAALEGKALRTDDLAGVVGCDRRKLFKPHGLKELVEAGWVAHSEKHGYYRPECPPQSLRGT